MDSFTLKGENGFIKINLTKVFDFPDKTCHWGGYDAEANIEIKSGNFHVNSSFYTSTGELFQFYECLKKCNELLTGTTVYKNYEKNLYITATYDNQGHVVVEGTFSEDNEFCNKLNYEFNSDQSFIKYSIQELGLIVNTYGGMKGLLQE